MGTLTKNAKLYKADPVADANKTFNIATMLNENWDKIDEKLEDTFDKLMEEYGYTKQKDVDAAKGTKTITVTVNASCPVAASLVAVFSKDGAGNTVVDTTTTVGATVKKTKHTLNKDGTAKGEKVNG